jgi:creatinine amidohydrolase
VNVEHPTALAAAAFYLSGKQSLARVDELRESVRGGMGHACELETSIYLAIDPDAVDMDKAVDERSYPDGQYAFMDWSDGPLKVMPWWSSFSRTGVQGDATKATPEKGEALLEAAVEECVGFVRELLSWPLPERLEPRETP